MAKAVLAEENSFLEANMDEFAKKHVDKFLLVKGAKLVAVYETESAAVDAGVEQFGRGPFLVRKAGQPAPVYHVPALALGILQDPSHADV